MLTEGVTENQRNACFRLAAQLRKAGLPCEYTILVLTKWAEKNHPSEGKAAISFGEIGSQTRAAYRGRPYLACGCEDESVIPFCATTCPIRRRRDSAAAATPGAPQDKSRSMQTNDGEGDEQRAGRGVAPAASLGATDSENVQ